MNSTPRLKQVDEEDDQPAEDKPNTEENKVEHANGRYDLPSQLAPKHEEPILVAQTELEQPAVTNAADGPDQGSEDNGMN